MTSVFPAPPAFPPLPMSLSLQAHCRDPDQLVVLTVASSDIVVLTT